MNYFNKSIICFLLLILSVVYTQNTEKKYPNINFDLFNGKKISIHELINSGPLVIQFWAIWCSPCKKEMYYLDKIQDKYKDSGVNVICINTDNLKSVPKAKAYVRQKKYDLLIAADPSSQIFKKLNASVMPTTLIMDKNGQIVYTKEGYMGGDEKKVEAVLKLLL
tara:strand:+ start:706 stop:1200 length:495 start_codon:yes stop_codon:yes gene_type:complete